MNRVQLIASLEQYQTHFAEEQDFIRPFLELLDHPRAYHRDHLPGHITGSAWIIDDERTHILLVEHKKLKKWLQPGGHADGDENISDVARKEAYEETGLSDLAPLTSEVFDLDIHPIPARGNFPEHLHYDVRFIFSANRQTPLQISEESTDLQWIPLTDVGVITKGNPSMIRMAAKVRRLLTTDQ